MSQVTNVRLKIRARESKTWETWQSDGPTIFFGSCYDVSHEKKTWHATVPWWGGAEILVQVAYSSIKNSKIRFEFRRLLDRLGVYERCQITQSERETISLRPAAPPRVNLVNFFDSSRYGFLVPKGYRETYSGDIAACLHISKYLADSGNGTMSAGIVSNFAVICPVVSIVSSRSWKIEGPELCSSLYERAVTLRRSFSTIKSSVKKSKHNS